MIPEICVLCPYGLDSGLTSKAAELATSVRVFVPEADLKKAIESGATIIHTIPALPVDESNISAWLKEKMLQYNCTVILASATIQMRNIMPMLAWQLDAGLTADCTQLSTDGNTLIQARPAFGNSLMATIKSKSNIQMATVRPGTFPVLKQDGNSPHIIRELLPTFKSPIVLTSYHPYEDLIPLSQSNIIIAGGLGIGSKEGFQKLEALASILGGTVAASRNAVDAGYAPYRCQVGMTGVTVNPKLYIAVGISGAVQHLAGISGSEKIIAINSDPKAPIFDYADYGIVSEWETVIDKLLEVLS